MINIESLLENSINDIINIYPSFFLNIQNVKGIALGYKIINGICTYEPTLHVLVNKKTPKNKLFKHNVIPQNFLGIKTDVIEIGTLSLTSNTSNNFSSTASNLITPTGTNNNLIIKKLRSRTRPIQPGCLISSLKNDSGTLGCIVFDNLTNIPYILSNNHILANYGLTKLNSHIFQPSFKNFFSFKNSIAKLDKYVQINPLISNYDYNSYNTMDAALARLNPDVAYTNTIYDMGKITKASNPKLNEAIFKIGAKTGYTTAKITSVNATVIVNEDDVSYKYKKQIMTSKLSEGGDSGSIVFDKYYNAIGLLVGGNDTSSTLTPLIDILKTLNVHL